MAVKSKLSGWRGQASEQIAAVDLDDLRDRLADRVAASDRVEPRQPDHRKAFVVGTLLGAGAGVVSAFMNAPRSGRATRADIQQRIEGVLFKVLDMRPTKPHAGADDMVVTGTHLTPADPPNVAATDGLTDIVIDGPRPSDLHA